MKRQNIDDNLKTTISIVERLLISTSICIKRVCAQNQFLAFQPLYHPGHDQRAVKGHQGKDNRRMIVRKAVDQPKTA